MQCKQKHAANCNACKKPFTSEFTNNLTNYIILCTAGVDRCSYLPVVLSNKSNSGRIQECFVLRKTQEEAGLCDGIPFQHTPMCAYHSILHSLVPVQILQRQQNATCFGNSTAASSSVEFVNSMRLEVGRSRFGIH